MFLLQALFSDSRRVSTMPRRFRFARPRLKIPFDLLFTLVWVSLLSRLELVTTVTWSLEYPSLCIQFQPLKLSR